MKRFLILIALCSSLTTAFAQEAGFANGCGNGIDDDGDGRIDCFDGDCVGSTACEGFYVVEDVCSAEPPVAPTFQMTLDFASPDETVNHLSRIAIGDLSGDGLPEIVTMEKYDKKIFILRGNNGTVYKSITVSYEPIWEVAIANIDNGNAGCGEIFIAGIENNIARFYAYDCELNLLWQSVIRDGGGKDPINYGLADFDGDGKVELYAKDIIFDAHTGTRIISTSTANGTEFDNINGGPVAVDMDPPGPTNDGRLELVIGLKIYDVNLGARTANSGSLTLRPGSPTNYFIRYPYNATSVADFNQDGFLDVLASGSDVNDASPTPTNDERTVIFFWDVQNNVVKTFYDTSPGAYNPVSPGSNGYGWKNGTGRINIADIDGDGKLNASYVSGKFLYALDENLNLKWRITINEETSGHTGCTLFDFVGDGSSEIVYRDEQYLYIINGVDGSVHTQQRCISRTNREYPIVADVDADGSTEICVPCMSDDNATWTDFNANAVLEYPAEVRVYKSATTPWVPARRVWNQHGYFNVNINDNLTVPRKLQFHQLEFSFSICKNDGTGTMKSVRPLNSFLNQTPFLDEFGCPVYATADLDFADNSSITVNAPTCPEVNFTVSFKLTNRGDLPISGNIPMTFYTGNPRRADQGAIKLNTVLVPLSALSLGEVFEVNNVQVNGIGADSLWVVLNDAGTYPTIPIPADPSNTTLNECEGQDIKGVPVEFLPAQITPSAINDFRCFDTAPPSGVVSAFVPTSGGGQNTTDYNFYWEAGASPPSPLTNADFVGPTYTQREPGEYTVIARHKTLNCGSLPESITVGTELPPDVQLIITEESPYNNCKNPNGKFKVTVMLNGAEQPIGNYNYKWTRDNGVEFGTSHVANNLTGTINGVEYTVEVEDKATGCLYNKSQTLFDMSVPVVVTATDQSITCSATSTATSNASVGGQTNGYTFEWFNGSNVKPAPDHTGDTYANLGAGSYTVVATDNNTQCESAPVTINVTQTTPPALTATATANMTSCDPAQPNGSASAHVNGVTAGFTFEWFRGQNTLAANKINPSTPDMTGLEAGIYTVKVTDANSCSATREVTIGFNVVTPTLAIAAIGDLTNCTTMNGSIEVSVSAGVPAEYDFFWFTGPTPTGTPLANTDHILENVAVGQYTVRAVHKTNHCVTNPITAEVEDNTPVIDISVDPFVTEPPSDCNENDGTIGINVSAPGNVNGFKIDLYSGIGAGKVFIRTVNPATSMTEGNLGTGMYTIQATNLDNGCSNFREYFLPFQDAHFVNILSQINIDKCPPLNNGSITFELLKSPDNALFTYSEANYKIHVILGDDLTVTPVAIIDGVAGQSQYTFNTTIPGKYWFVAIAQNPAPTEGCRAFASTTLTETLAFPSILSVGTPVNTSCGGATIGNGSITLNIDGAAPETNYTYAWFEGAGTGTPIGTNTSGTAVAHVASNLPPGQYTVQVTTIASACPSTTTITVFDNPPLITMTSPGLTVTGMSVCPPLASNGGAIVTEITENGSNVAIPNAGYTFEWRNSAQALIGNPAPSHDITGLLPGKYYVTAINAGNCSSSQVEFEVIDMTPNSPTIELIRFVDPTRCLKPANVSGELEVTVTSATGTHTVNWYAGTTVAGAPVFTGTNFVGITVPPGNPDITFTVEAVNNLTACRSQEIYVLPVEVAPITISVSAAPMTFCNNPFDGQVSATVMHEVPAVANQYNYNWVDQDGNPYTGRVVNDLAAGIYTVTATDQMADPLDGCVVVSEPVEVTEQRVYPVVSATAMMPNTNCDPTIPNGVASASVGGNVSNYTFDWFAGEAPFGASIETGPQADGLSSILYSVIAADIVTGCSDTTSVTVPDGTVLIPATQIQVNVLSNVTTCQEGPDSPAPNGALSASVNGNVIDYKFFWYNSDPGPDPDTATAVFKGSEFYSGPTMEGLDVGTYYVSVVHRVTGCPGGPASGTIIRENLYPEFTFETEDATCKKNELEVADGYVTIMMTNGNDIDVEKIEWFEVDENGAFIVDGPNLMDVDAGLYWVKVTSRQGCSAGKQVELKSEIRPFNGISRNGDGMNDIFLIKCLEQFPNNTVKIFNRAGTLVFQENNYDNIDIFFDGRSNKGVSMMGTNLPDGTYFYVIDKGDGSKPVAGYLEIVN
jgi:gliding motility-associated-like protein